MKILAAGLFALLAILSGLLTGRVMAATVVFNAPTCTGATPNCYAQTVNDLQVGSDLYRVEFYQGVYLGTGSPFAPDTVYGALGDPILTALGAALEGAGARGVTPASGSFSRQFYLPISIFSVSRGTVTYVRIRRTYFHPGISSWPSPVTLSATQVTTSPRMWAYASLTGTVSLVPLPPARHFSPAAWAFLAR